MRCDKCERDFSTDEGFEQHTRDKHSVTSHESKEMRRQDREKQSAVDRKKYKSDKMLKNIAMAAVAVVLVGVVSYFMLTAKPTQATAPRLDLSGIPPGNIHWHAQAQIFICGERRMLPEGSDATTHIGSGVLHTHDKVTNIQSFPGTDGNGIVHIEGDVLSSPPAFTLDKFMSAVGITFDNDTIMEKSNGDLCGDTPGTIKATLNDKPVEIGKLLNYIVRDHDVIRIEFN